MTMTTLHTTDDANAYRHPHGNWAAAVAFLACQDRAVTMAQRLRRVAVADISLPIPLDQVQALTVTPGSVPVAR